MTAHPKTVMRALMRTRLAAISPLERAARSADLAESVLGSRAWREARCVLAYAALADEPDLLPLWKAPGGRVLCLPRTLPEWRLEAHRAGDPCGLRPGRFGVREPADDPGTRVSVEKIDLILVPGLAFTSGGFRLGRGAGYYDRFLSTPGLVAGKIGIGFAFQLVPEIPVESHDMRLDGVITDRLPIPPEFKTLGSPAGDGYPPAS